MLIGEFVCVCVVYIFAFSPFSRRTFDENFLYRDTAKGPIGQNTVLTLNPETGVVEHGWGSNYFYLPHGLYIDPSGDYWITDVAMHQVFKVFFPQSL